jgi:signal transduction histidine kinase
MKMIVHDLKTPLTSVLATLEMMKDGDFGSVNDNQRSALSDAEHKAQDLLGLIEDLLEVARIEETKLQLATSQIVPVQFLEEIVGEWGVRFRQEGASVELDIPADLHAIEGDRALLKRVFTNLIQNALVHSAEAVTLRLSARQEPDGVLFTVADNGPGIPSEYHEVIFRKFERAKTPNVPRVRSSGLGLAFCKLVVDAHGGRIWVRSGEGEGSTFHILLPTQPVAR